jgi:hypothetical protein
MSTKLSIPHGQRDLYVCLADSQIMNELIERFDTNIYDNSFLKDLINERNIRKLNSKFIIIPRFNFSRNKNYHSIYINYFLNNVQVFHGSIHLCTNNFLTRNSPAHFKENNQYGNPPLTSLVMEICNDPNQVNGIKFCIGQYVIGTQFRNTTLQDEVDAIQSVLTKYFNPINTHMYLGNPRFPQRQNIQQIMTNFQRRTLPLIGGRKSIKIKKIRKIRKTRRNKT